jgi:polysaccharide transporter, PST family
MEGPISRSQLKGISVKGMIVSFGSQGGRFVLQFVYSVLLARLLTPSDFGIVAMASPITAFVQMFADFGLTQATVQRQDISEDELSFMFWVSLAASTALGLITLIAAPLADTFYGDKRVGPVIAALGLMLMLSGGYSQQLALMNRRLRFGHLAAVDLISNLVGTVAGITAAALRFSYWSIVLGQVMTTVAALILAWALVGWIPRRPRLVFSARQLLGFGGNVTTFNTLNYFARNLDNILIGKFAGEGALGHYDRAYKLLLFPLSQITTPVGKVATPLLSRILSEVDLYKRAYFRLLEVIMLLTFPGVIFAGIHSQAVVTLVLGPQWYYASQIFAVLSIGALFAPISNSTGWLLTTQDRTAEMRNYGAISSVAFVISFLLGLRWGAIGVARCYILVGSIQGPLLWWATTRKGPVSFPDLLRTLAPYTLAGLFTAVAEVPLRGAFHGTVVFLAGMLILAYLVFLAGLALTQRGREALRDVRDQVSILLKRKPSSAPRAA